MDVDFLGRLWSQELLETVSEFSKVESVLTYAHLMDYQMERCSESQRDFWMDSKKAPNLGFLMDRKMD